jgi:hypothetical protein
MPETHSEIAGPFRWMRIPIERGTVVVLDDGQIHLPEDEVCTGEAAKMLGYAVRTVQAMCDEGRLIEGIDWVKARGRGTIGRYRIRRASIQRLLRDRRSAA